MIKIEPIGVGRKEIQQAICPNCRGVAKFYVENYPKQFGGYKVTCIECCKTFNKEDIKLEGEDSKISEKGKTELANAGYAEAKKDRETKARHWQECKNKPVGG